MTRVNELERSLQEKTELLTKALAVSAEGTVSTSTKQDDLKAQISQLNDTIEMLTLDKEQLMVDNELAEENQNKLNAQVAQLEAELKGVKNQDQRELARENEKLREALKILHEQSSRVKEEAQLNCRQVDLNAKELTDLREFKHKASSELEELRRALNDSKVGDLEVMIESLSEKNNQLHLRAKELETTVHDLESAQEMLEELDISQRAEIDRLRKNEDTLTVALQQKEREQQGLETKCGELRKLYDAVAKNANMTKEESEALKAKLKANSEVLEETTLKTRSVATLKVQVDTLLNQLAFSESKIAAVEAQALSAEISASRLVAVFGDLLAWRQEKICLASELQAITQARAGSVAFLARKSAMLSAPRVTVDDVYLAQGILDGTRLCWKSAANLLMSSTHAPRDTTAFYDLFSHRGTILPPIVKKVVSQDIRDRVPAGSDLDNSVMLSFLLHSIDLISTALPKLEAFHGDAELSQLCNDIAEEVKRKSALNLVVAFADNRELLCEAYDFLFSSLTEPASEKLISAHRSLRGLQGKTSGNAFSLLDASLLVKWCSVREGPAFEWVNRCDKLRLECNAYDNDHRKLQEVTAALESLTIEYQLRKEEARVATLRAAELGKVLDGTGSEAGGSSKALEEIRTLTEALEVLEQRNEVAEKELKRLNGFGGPKQSYGASGGMSESLEYFGTSVESLAYWRRVAVQKLSSQLPVLSSDAVTDVPPSILPLYRAKRLERACVRVASFQ